MPIDEAINPIMAKWFVLVSKICSENLVGSRVDIIMGKGKATISRVEGEINNMFLLWGQSVLCGIKRTH